jgi:DNA-binding transcriptional ArsR family regulator
MDLTPALALLPSQGYIADFLTPPPSTPLASFADELEIVRSTPTDQILHDIQMLLDDANDPETLEPFLSDPRGEVERLADVLQIFWQRAVEPHWPRVRSLLEADLMYRSRRLTEGGLEKLFGDLHPSVLWEDRTLTLTENKCDTDGSLHGQGLLLLPSAFSSARTWAMVEAEWQPTLIYPARGVGLLWESGERAAPEGLAKVMGASRAALLTDLDAPRSTSDLAERLGMTAGGVSQHLGALKDAGLVTAERNGRSVLYCRSAVADELVVR